MNLNSLYANALSCVLIKYQNTTSRGIHIDLETARNEIVWRWGERDPYAWAPTTVHFSVPVSSFHSNVVARTAPLDPW
jgi:hypothetical protein